MDLLGTYHQNKISPFCQKKRKQFQFEAQLNLKLCCDDHFQLCFIHAVVFSNLKSQHENSKVLQQFLFFLFVGLFNEPQYSIEVHKYRHKFMLKAQCGAFLVFNRNISNC